MNTDLGASKGSSMLLAIDARDIESDNSHNADFRSFRDADKLLSLEPIPRTKKARSNTSETGKIKGGSKS
jgi:hypothetical protein